MESPLTTGPMPKSSQCAEYTMHSFGRVVSGSTATTLLEAFRTILLRMDVLKFRPRGRPRKPCLATARVRLASVSACALLTS